MNEFRYIGYAQEIIFGAGSVSRLNEAVERLKGTSFRYPPDLLNALLARHSRQDKS